MRYDSREMMFEILVFLAFNQCLTLWGKGWQMQPILSPSHLPGNDDLAFVRREASLPVAWAGVSGLAFGDNKISVQPVGMFLLSKQDFLVASLLKLSLLFKKKKLNCKL